MKCERHSHSFHCTGLDCVKEVTASGPHDSLSSLVLYHTDVVGILERSKQSVPRITNLTVHPSALPHELLLNDASSFPSLKNVHTLDVPLYNMADGCHLRDVLSERLCTLRNLIVVHMRGNVGLLTAVDSSHHLPASGLRIVTIQRRDHRTSADGTVDRRLLDWW
ncbi:hypothetical protein ARMGADRAFT_563312 [Armillaria gallica]|uniref:Uncharacterized protein n=1 Tax=Armillaria gallica TaxID=47427 RepID=A0A2H3CVA0_ARMGA|nr:hypothetical protein ARMGADRAFT_563312 [Armillaria gallica]